MQTRTGKIAALAITTGAILGIAVFCPPGSAPAQAAEPGAMIWEAKKPAAPAADAPQLNDGAIAYLYLQSNLFEVDVAELGKSAGASDEVKALGQMVASDHRGVVKSFEELLEMNHIKPIETPASTAAIAQHQGPASRCQCNRPVGRTGGSPMRERRSWPPFITQGVGPRCRSIMPRSLPSSAISMERRDR